MKMASKEDVARIVEDFLNDKGLWWKFKDFVEAQGYTLGELGFTEDE